MMQNHVVTDAEGGAQLNGKYGWLIRKIRKSLEHRWVRFLLVGILVTLSSELYLLPNIGGLRFSGAVILYQVLLCKLVPDRRLGQVGLVTGCVVWLFRMLWALAAGEAFATAALEIAPGAIFYLSYDLLFFLLLPRERMRSFWQLWLAGFMSDVLSNIMEITVSTGLAPQSRQTYTLLAGVALFRSLVAMAVLGWLIYYRRMLVLGEQEVRYQRLFLLKAQLRDEVYFLKKTTEEIERVMGMAYRLYERLEEDAEQRQLALEIARDVHEIKKDHLRILRGVEAEVCAVNDWEVMSAHELLGIVQSSAEKMIPSQQEAPLHLRAVLEHDFVTAEHYRLMSILRNLITNAVEAIEHTAAAGSITMGVRLEGGEILLWVEDDGPGIPEKLRDKVFQIGYSTKFDPLTGDMNRGVGLAVVTTMTQELGGRVTLETKKDRGCRFSVYIPRERLEQRDANLHR